MTTGFDTDSCLLDDPPLFTLSSIQEAQISTSTSPGVLSNIHKSECKAEGEHLQHFIMFQGVAFRQPLPCEQK